MLRRIRWAAAQFGRKPGADAALTMLLKVSDLPGEGWKQLDERTWRTGEADPDSEWARRAREIGSITSWRSFEQSGESRWLWCQATPLASADDVGFAMSDLPTKMLRNLRSDVEVVSNREVESPVVQGVGRTWAYEQTTKGPRREGTVLYLAAQVRRGLSILCASGDTQHWDWAGLSGLAEIQVSRVEGVLGPGEDG